MEISLCEYRFGDGRKCSAWALHGEHYCRHHLRYRDKRDITSTDYEMPDLDDHQSVQLLVNEAIRGLVAGKLDPKQAKNLLWAASVAASNLKNISKSRPPVTKVRFSSDTLSDAIASLRDYTIAVGPEAGRTFGEVLDARLTKLAAERGETQ